MRYVVLLRGVNVGGKNKVPMADLKNRVSALGFSHVSTYINSGNLFFNSAAPVQTIESELQHMLQSAYPFDVPFVAISARQYAEECLQLPPWWDEPYARKNVLFYLNSFNHEDARMRLSQLPLHNERLHIGPLALYWGIEHEADRAKTAYAKHLAKTPLYRHLTIRNSNTFAKIAELIAE